MERYYYGFEVRPGRAYVTKANFASSDAACEIVAHLTIFKTNSIDLPHPVLFTGCHEPESIAKRKSKSILWPSAILNIKGQSDVDVRYHVMITSKKGR